MADTKTDAIVRDFQQIGLCTQVKEVTKGTLQGQIAPEVMAELSSIDRQIKALEIRRKNILEVVDKHGIEHVVSHFGSHKWDHS